jgi:lipid A 3-O-deacylase
MRFLFSLGAVCLAAAASAARAENGGLGGIVYDVSGGVLAHDVPDLWSGTNLERGTTFNGEVIFTPALHVLWGAIRPDLGASITTNGGTSYGYGGVVYQVMLPAGIFLGAGVGGAVHDGHLKADSPDHKGLGSRVLFHVPLEAGIELAEHYRVSVYFEHISNAYLTSPNEGLDNLGVRFGYRF